MDNFFGLILPSYQELVKRFVCNVNLEKNVARFYVNLQHTFSEYPKSDAKKPKLDAKKSIKLKLLSLSPRVAQALKKFGLKPPK